MREENKPLDQGKTSDLAHQLITKIIEAILTTEKSKESSVAAIAALSNVLAICACKLVGRKKAVDIITIAISRALETINEYREDLPP